MSEDCVFCDHDRLREADLYFENEFCIYASTRDPRDPPDVIPGCGGIAPKAHRTSPFDLTTKENGRRHANCCWCEPSSTSGSLPTATHSAGTTRPGSDPHLRVIPRFDDEPMADHGVRSGIKDPANRRPDPRRPGIGRRTAGP